MQVKEIMTAEPMCCSPETTLVEAARVMVGYDCGEVPVIGDRENKNLVGVITDRDIVCRAVAENINPSEMKVGECMTAPAISVKEDASIEECIRQMQENQIRRIPVVTADGAVCGIVALADITKHASEQNAGAILRDVSVETDDSSNASSVSLNDQVKDVTG